MRTIFFKLNARKIAIWSCLACILTYIIYILLFIPNEEIVIKNRNSHYKASRTIRALDGDALDIMVKKSADEHGEIEHYLNPFLVERVSGSKGNSDVQKHIEKSMLALGWDIQTDSFVDKTPHGDKKFTNIIATQNPDARRKLILSCHFDSKYFAEFTFIAATDSAVPCAIIMSIAARLNDALRMSKSNDITLQLVFFDGEEAFEQWTETDSLYGSRHLAKLWQHTKPKDGYKNSKSILNNIDLMVLLDLMGQKGGQYHSWFPKTHRVFSNLQAIEERLKEEAYLSLAHTYFPTSNYRSSGGIQDDHIPFTSRGVPVLHMIAYPFPKQWHTIEDNPSILDMQTIRDMELIFRIFVAEYLHLSIR